MVRKSGVITLICIIAAVAGYSLTLLMNTQSFSFTEDGEGFIDLNPSLPCAIRVVGHYEMTTVERICCYVNVSDTLGNHVADGAFCISSTSPQVKEEYGDCVIELPAYDRYNVRVWYGAWGQPKTRIITFEVSQLRSAEMQLVYNIGMGVFVGAMVIGLWAVCFFIGGMCNPEPSKDTD
jgi:hypothetical protein